MIATRVGGIPEIFAGREQNLVAPGDSIALATAMQDALSNPTDAQAKADAHRDLIARDFSLARMSRGVLSLYAAGDVAVETGTPSGHVHDKVSDVPPLMAGGSKG